MEKGAWERRSPERLLPSPPAASPGCDGGRAKRRAALESGVPRRFPRGTMVGRGGDDGWTDGGFRQISMESAARRMHG